MKIATMVKGFITAPPPSDLIFAPYDVARWLCDGLVPRGHQIDFFAPEGSETGRARLVTLGQQPLVHTKAEFDDACRNIGYHLDNVLAMWDQRLAAEMFRRARRGEYDVLHFHHPEVALPYVEDYPDVPVVYTMHDPIAPIQKQILQQFMTPSQFLVTISDKQRDTAPDLPYIATVYNGIDTKMFNFNPAEKRDDYLLYTGRMAPEKGIKECVEVARKAHRRLLLIGPRFPDQEDYFNKYVTPYLNDSIQYLGALPHDKVAPYFQKAAAFLMPIQWEEPFGLTMAEAMACGAPVLGFDRGSVPEIVKDGVSGFVTHTVDEMVASVNRLGELDHQKVRAHAVAHFSTDVMARGYEAVFEDAIRRAAGAKH